LRKNLPEIVDPIAFVHIWNQSLIENLVPYFDHIVDDTVVVGSIDALQELGEKANLEYRPLCYFNEFVAVRVISS